MAAKFIDKNGYEREVGSNRLVHRDIAYWQIYLPNSHLFSRPFRVYQVHHRDRKKRNNAVWNLQIVTREEHKSIHGIGEHSLFEFLGWLILASVILGFILLAVIISVGAMLG